MLNDERKENYLVVTRKRKLRENEKNRALSYTTGRKELTPAQWRRLNHKLTSRKTHDHDRESVPEGQRFRCTACAPFPFTQPVTLKAAEGPRDWSPS